MPTDLATRIAGVRADLEALGNDEWSQGVHEALALIAEVVNELSVPRVPVAMADAARLLQARIANAPGPPDTPEEWRDGYVTGLEEALMVMGW